MNIDISDLDKARKALGLHTAKALERLKKGSNPKVHANKLTPLQGRLGCSCQRPVDDVHNHVIDTGTMVGLELYQGFGPEIKPEVCIIKNMKARLLPDLWSRNLVAVKVEFGNSASQIFLRL